MPNVRIVLIFVTAHDDEHIGDENSELGAFAYLQKSFKPPELHEKVPGGEPAGV